MPIIKILNRDYQIDCGPGQEAKLYDLADKLDKRIVQNAKNFRSANEITLIVLTALMMEDEIQDIKKTTSSTLDEEKLGELTQRIEKLIEEFNSN